MQENLEPSEPSSSGAARAASSLVRERLLIAVISILLVYPFFYGYFPPQPHERRVHLWSDASGFTYPLLWYGFQALKEGRIPLWDSSIYCGISYIGNVQASFLYPPNWLLFASVWTLPRIPFKAVEAFAFLHVWLAFFLCYLWLRSRTGALAAILGALVFSCGGYLLYQLLHLGVVFSMPWMPLGFWGLDEAVERRDWRPLWKVAAASALAFLAGYPACWIAHCFAMGFYALGSRAPVRAIIACAAGLAASIPLMAAQLLPSLDGRSLMLLEAKYGAGAYRLKSLLAAFFTPNFLDFNPGHPAAYEPGCMYLYLGIPAIFAILWALWRHQLRPYIQALVVLAAALLLANPPGFLLHAVARVSFLNYTMQPYNFYAVVSAAAALFTALSLHDFLERPDPRPLPEWVGPVAISALTAWSMRKIDTAIAGGQFATGWLSAVETAIALGLVAFALWAIRRVAGTRRLQFAAVLLFSVVVDFKVFGAPRWFNATVGDVEDERPSYGIGGIDDVAYRAMMANRQFRVVTDQDAGPHPTDFRVWELATPQGFDPFLPTQYRATIQQWVPFSTNRLFYPDLRNESMMRALAVRYVMVWDTYPDAARLAVDPDFRLIGRPAIFMRVYEYLHALAPYHWENDPAGFAEPTGWIPEHRDLRVRSATGGRFVLVEQFFPGWHASVDGRPATIERWGGAFQAISVPAGEHHVTFEFRPASFRIGAAISLCSAILLAFVALSRTKAS